MFGCCCVAAMIEAAVFVTESSYFGGHQKD